MLDAWLAFARIEPETFGIAPGAAAEQTHDGKPIRWMDPARAAKLLAERFARTAT